MFAKTVCSSILFMFAALAAGGVYRAPYVITRITDRAGTELFRHVPEETRVMSEDNAFILTSLLESVAQQGTASLLSSLPIPLAAKTGTVGDETGNRDIWLACFNPDSVALDEATLKNEHLAVLAGSLTPEEHVVFEYFARGTEPKTVTEYWQIPDPPTDLMVTLTDGVAEITFTPPSRYICYRLYREDDAGFAILLTTFENASYPVRFSDPVAGLNGNYSYYVVPVHPALLLNGEPVCGRTSGKRRISVTHSFLFSP